MATAYGQTAPKDLLMYVACLRQQAAQLDDHVSDASTIGAVVVNICRTRRAEYLRQIEPGSSMIINLGQAATREDIELGVTVVVQERAKNRRR